MQDKHFLETVKWGVLPIVSYNGVLVAKTKDGYSLLQTKAKDVKEVDSIISRSLKCIQQSIITS